MPCAWRARRRYINLYARLRMLLAPRLLPCLHILTMSTSLPPLNTVLDVPDTVTSPVADIPTADASTLLPPSSSLAIERALTYLQPGLTTTSPEFAAIARALASFEAIRVAVNVKQTIDAPGGGDTKVELLEDYYMFIGGARLRTYILRITGRTSGSISEVDTI